LVGQIQKAASAEEADTKEATFGSTNTESDSGSKTESAAFTEDGDAAFTVPFTEAEGYGDPFAFP